MMKTYSQYDLLGEKLDNRTRRKGIAGIFSTMVNLPNNNNYKFKLAPSIYVYLQTLSLCDSITQDYQELDEDYIFEYNDLVGYLVVDFVENFNMNIGLKYINNIKPNDSFVIIDHNHSKQEIVSSPNETKTCWLTLTKEYSYKCEMVLFDLDDMYGHNVDVPGLILNIWTNFIEENRFVPRSKLKNKIIRLINKNLKYL